MKIAMIGQKGIPATHGGIERHVEELCVRMADRGHEVTVFTRSKYTDAKVKSYRGVRLVSLPTVGTKHLDAIVHALIASLYAWSGGYDIVHYHAIGPCLASPLSRVRGRRTVATIHGQDWKREKWGRFAKQVLRLGERMAVHVPHRTISVSDTLAEYYEGAYGKRPAYIPNGIAVCDTSDDCILDELGLTTQEYILFAGRLVPEKGLHYLLEAYSDLGVDIPLVVAGDSSASDDYVITVKSQLARGVKFCGYQYGEKLAALFRNAGLFVLPSDVEGLPIVLLEALAYGCPVLASDIPPNQEILGLQGTYFRAGDAKHLAHQLAGALAQRDSLAQTARCRAKEVSREYDWDRIADQTLELYESLVDGG